MKKQYLYGSVAFALIAILGISLVSAFGFGGMMNPNLTDEQRAEMQEHREAMQNAIESGDYESWKSLMEERVTKLQTRINEENFQKQVEMHEQRGQIRELMQQLKEARDSGDEDKITELQEQLKELVPQGFKMGFKMGKHQGMQNCPMAGAE